MTKIEALQIELEKDPRSPAFAQLAELYLAENMVDEAQMLVERSLKYSPHSVSGLILMGRILQLRSDDLQALDYLDKAISRAPTNWQALLLRAELFMKKQQPKKALADFKKVLFLNPQHPLARRAVAKLDVLTADDYDDDVFAIQSVQQIAQPKNTPSAQSPPTPDPWIITNQKLERILSLVDAFTIRQDYNRALKLLRETHTEYGDHPEIQTRFLRLSQFETAEKIRPASEAQETHARAEMATQKKIHALELLLRRIHQFKERSLVP